MTLPPDFADLQSKMSETVRNHWKAFLVEGIILVILGLAAIIVPPIASIAVTVVLGWMFFVGGIAALLMTFWARQAPGFIWSLISAVLGIAAGIVLLTRPAESTLTLTVVVGIYFLAEGVATIMYALQHRKELSQRWSWMAFSGLMDIAIAFFIISGLPGSAAWAIGVLVGINLVIGGSSLIGLALAAKNKA